MTTTTQQDAIAAAIAEGVAQALAALGLSTETPAAPEAPSTDKAYRSASAKAKARTAADKVWADAKAKAGVKRVKDLTPKAQDECRAAVKAIWAKAPKTRTTPAN